VFLLALYFGRFLKVIGFVKVLTLANNPLGARGGYVCNHLFVLLIFFFLNVKFVVHFFIVVAGFGVW